MRRRLLILLLALVGGLGIAAPALAGGTLIYVRNDESASVPQAQADKVTAALQVAVTRDFAPIWGTDATLTTDPALKDEATMSIELMDYSPISGALGFHDTFGGKPVSYVFVKESQDAREAWPLVMGHELFEMLADPWVDRLSFDPLTQKIWSVEVCDPVESGYYAYWINGVPISDFVLPSWYDAPVLGKFDFTGKLKRPHQVGFHGYAQWYDPSLAVWHTVLGYHAKRGR